MILCCMPCRILEDLSNDPSADLSKILIRLWSTMITLLLHYLLVIWLLHFRIYHFHSTCFPRLVHKMAYQDSSRDKAPCGETLSRLECCLPYENWASGSVLVQAVDENSQFFFLKRMWWWMFAFLAKLLRSLCTSCHVFALRSIIWGSSMLETIRIMHKAWLILLKSNN